MSKNKPFSPLFVVSKDQLELWTDTRCNLPIVSERPYPGEKRGQCPKCEPIEERESMCRILDATRTRRNSRRPVPLGIALLKLGETGPYMEVFLDVSANGVPRGMIHRYVVGVLVVVSCTMDGVGNVVFEARNKE